MSPEEYADAQAVISTQVGLFTLRFGKLFSKAALSVADWLGFLQFLFPQVEALRRESARLGREFYDFQRAQAHPELPRNDRFLESYDFERFVRDMDPARERMSQADSNDNAVAQAALQAIRAVENGGRQQIIHAVQDDPEDKIIRGWARVATGRETCAWCLMLVSRGPTYLGSDTAGIDLYDDDVLELFHGAANLQEFFDAIDPYMEQWHAGCDCKAVPVFKHQVEWPGKAAQEKALSLWNDATREAIDQEDNPGSHTHGKKKGKEFTRNELALNALRRRLSSGDISPSEWAALAAA